MTKVNPRRDTYWGKYGQHLLIIEPEIGEILESERFGL